MNGDIVKIIDENGIEREAKIITTIKENGIDYVVYVINRDGDNSNIFVSRLVSGVEFVDIVDKEEKERLDGIVKNIIKKAME